MNWHIKINPRFAGNYTVLVTDGTSLWIDGSEIDLSTIMPGEQAKIDHDQIREPVINVDGVIHVTVTFCSPIYSPEEYNFPNEDGYTHEGDGEFWLLGGRPNLNFPEGPQAKFVFANTDPDPDAPPNYYEAPPSIPRVETKGPLS